MQPNHGQQPDGWHRLERCDHHRLHGFDINTGESFLANDKKWLLEFELKGLWLNLFQWFTIDLDKTFAGLAGGDSRSSLLTAIDLNSLSWGRHFYPTLDLLDNR